MSPGLFVLGGRYKWGLDHAFASQRCHLALRQPEQVAEDVLLVLPDGRRPQRVVWGRARELRDEALDLVLTDLGVLDQRVDVPVP